jgi:hypothetical protein
MKSRGHPIYELWDEASSNQLGAYRTEAEALALIRALADANPGENGASLALLREDSRGRVTTIACGTALVDRARGAVSSDLPGHANR